MIFLFTDFGAEGPYLGQVEGALRQSGSREVIHLVSNAPRYDAQASAFLLAALVPFTAPASVILGVVDPGVGGDRQPVAMRAGGRWFVGPDNGLFNTVAARSAEVAWFRLDWRPDLLSPTFHGRDLFAPIAARIDRHDFTWDRSDYGGPDLASWPADLDRVIYFDTYGNAMTGRRHVPQLSGRTLVVGVHRLAEATTFCAVPPGTAFWYRNSIGLVEVAVNRGSARDVLQLEVGLKIEFA